MKDKTKDIMMNTTTEADVAWETIFDEVVPCDLDHHGLPAGHPAQWYVKFGCDNCDTWDLIAVCDVARREYEIQFDEPSNCPCGVDDVTFRYFFHGFTPIRG